MADIKKEFYLSFFLNRTKRCYSIIASSQGGIEIESVNNKIIIDIPDIDGIPSELASHVANNIKLNILKKLLLLNLFKNYQNSFMKKKQNWQKSIR